jgi:phosphatidylinositol alpha-mannosyltransferase
VACVGGSVRDIVSVNRVVLVSPYALSVFGGVQEQVLAMSRVLSARGKEVLVVVPDGQDAAPYDTPARVLRFGARLSLPANGSKAPLTLSPGAASKANAAVRAFSPDVVHFHEPFAPLLGWATLRSHDFAQVGTFHRAGSGPALTLTRPLLGYLASFLDAAVSVSESAASTIKSACGLTTHVLFNGFEVERFVANPRERSNQTVLFYVGRLERRKGVATLVEAVREHNARASTPWHLVIAGDGADRGRLEAMAAHDEEILFLGRISDDEKRRWLRRVNALVAPSTHGESFGLVLLEGMASETLVVASDIDGYREAASTHATLFAPGDAASLERAIEMALAGENVTSIDEARRYAERWSMKTLMDEYEECYLAAMGRFQVAQ